MTKEEAIARLQADLGWHHSDGNRKAHEMGIQALERTRWIPCSERIPKGAVLCCDDRGNMLAGLLCEDETGYMAYDDDGQEMYNCVAWMQLPEPYKGEKKMKNKEKYAKEIIEIACSGNVVAVSKVHGKPIGCENNSCEDCDRYNDFLCFRKERLKEWAESEYIEKPVISKKDRAFLEYLGKDLKYIARDKSEALFTYERAIEKGKYGWVYDSGVLKNLRGFSVDLPMVKWSDDSPWLIEDLKQLEVVEDYE